MAAIYALTICLVLYAIGDIVSVKTKGLLSLVFVLCVVMPVSYTHLTLPTTSRV